MRLEPVWSGREPQSSTPGPRRPLQPQPELRTLSGLHEDRTRPPALTCLKEDVPATEAEEEVEEEEDAEGRRRGVRGDVGFLYSIESLVSVCCLHVGLKPRRRCRRGEAERKVKSQEIEGR